MFKKAKPTTKEMTTQIITDNVLNFLSYMPNPDDVISGSFSSYDTYRKMISDPKIKSSLGKIKTGALNFPLNIVKGEADEKVYDFIRKLPLFRNMHKKNRRMLTALNYGFSVSELIWDLKDGVWIPVNFITRKPERFHFNANWDLFLVQNGMKTKLDQNYKWLVFQHEPDDENPYGTSMLKCVYWAWMFKQAGYDFWVQATEKFSVKTLVALFEAEGDETKISARANSIAEMLMGIQSGSAAAVGNVKEIKDVGMNGELAGFKELVEACDLQISYGLTGQAVATNAANGGSLALGQVQAELLYEDCKSIALELQSVLQQIIDWTVELNFGEDAKAPLIQYAVDRRASFEEVMKAIDHRIPVSKSALYSYYGVPEPSDDDDAFIMENGSAMTLSDSSRPKDVKKNFRFF